MPRDLILGTAGHIDHGKTALVKALTGTDCDRLPEEKKRGITIDIGFATLDLGEYRLGIVDVPGHERFVRNMLAGATGIDLVMLIVAADDSVMPQTREHFEILRLLGLRQGLIVITKCDLVDATTRDVVELEIRELVQGSFLERAPILHTSAHTGTGISELKAAIAEVCAHVETRTAAEWFRLAIDRSFIVQGHGTVVTGSATSGSLKVGDEVEWLPRGERVRVRSLQNHGQAVDEVHRGQRAAINLAGVHHENVIRGQELATPGYLVPSRTLSVRLHCLADARRPLKHRTQVRFHIGAAENMAVVSLLDADRLEPGRTGMAQLFLEEPAVTAWGQLFIVRTSSAEHTLGGGQVLQPVARKVRRQQLDMLERFERLAGADAEQRALTVAWFAGVPGVTAADVVRGAGVGPEEAAVLLRRLLDRGELVEVGEGAPAETLLHVDVVTDLEERVLAVLTRLHAEMPFAPAHEMVKVKTALAYLGNEPLLDFIIRRLVLKKRIKRDGQRLTLSTFKPKLSVNLLKLKDKVVAAYKEAGLKPPRAESFAAQAGGHAAHLDELFALCVAEGQLVHLDEDYYLDSAAADQVRQMLAEKLTASNGMTVADIRDALGTGRKQAMLVCQYLDRIGVTRREGDLRFLAK
ncbi:MAG: selenocysteine-specific translation elongation factor [Planctomycetia bacterium]|nr:selenocysteine-specific translation elongation factor [Planctomycetia bacterium]